MKNKEEIEKNAKLTSDVKKKDSTKKEISSTKEKSKSKSKESANASSIKSPTKETKKSSSTLTNDKVEKDTKTVQKPVSKNPEVAMDKFVKPSQGSSSKKNPEVAKEKSAKSNSKKSSKKQSSFTKKWNSSKKFKYGFSLGAASVLALSLGLGLGLGLSNNNNDDSAVSPGFSFNSKDDIPLPTDDPSYIFEKYSDIYDNAVLYMFDELAAQGLISNASFKKQKAEDIADQSIDEEREGFKNDYGSKTWQEEWDTYISGLGFDSEEEYRYHKIAGNLSSDLSNAFKFKFNLVPTENVDPNPLVSSDVYWGVDDTSALENNDLVLDTDPESPNYLKYVSVDGTYVHDFSEPQDDNIIYNQKYCSLSVNTHDTTTVDDDTKACLSVSTQPVFDLYVKEYKPVEISHILFGVDYGVNPDSIEGEETADTSSGLIYNDVVTMSDTNFINYYKFLLHLDNFGKTSAKPFNFSQAAERYGTDGSSSAGGSLGMVSMLETGFQEEFNSGLYSIFSDRFIKSNGTLTSTLPEYEFETSNNFYSSHIFPSFSNDSYFNGSAPSGITDFNENLDTYFSRFNETSYNHMSISATDDMQGVVTNESSGKYREVLYKMKNSLVISDDFYDTPLDTPGDLTPDNLTIESNMQYPVIVSRNGIHIVKIDQLHRSEYYDGMDISSSGSTKPTDPNYYAKSSGKNLLLTDGTNVLEELSYRNLVSQLNTVAETGQGTEINAEMGSSYLGWVSTNLNYIITRNALTSKDFYSTYDVKEEEFDLFNQINYSNLSNKINSLYNINSEFFSTNNSAYINYDLGGTVSDMEDWFNSEVLNSILNINYSDWKLDPTEIGITVNADGVYRPN